MALKQILLSEAQEGMELANDVYDNSGRLVVPFGTILDKEIIGKMESYKVAIIKVVEESGIDELFRKRNQVEKSTATEPAYFEKIKNSREFIEFDKRFNESVDGLRVEINDIVFKNKVIHLDEILRSVKKIIATNKTKYNLLDMLNCMRGYDDLTFVHSMNVAMICNIMADWLHYSESDCDILMAAGLLHDIGKVRVPKEIITKPGKLTDKEYSIVKMHPVLGYEVLWNQPIDIRIKNAALMHHERFDGGGYPRNLKGNEIDEIARVVAIADVYDAMTSNRVYREGMSPFYVIEFFEGHMSSFDPRILMIFLQRIAQAYVSNTVLLSNGEEGKIAMINNNAAGRPVVIVGNKAIDLSKDKSIKIVKLI